MTDDELNRIESQATHVRTKADVLALVAEVRRLRAALAAAPRWVSVTEAETALRQLGIALLEHRQIISGDKPAEAQENGLEDAYNAIDALAVRLALAQPAPAPASPESQEDA